MKRIDNATCDVCAREHVNVVQFGTSGGDVPARVDSACVCGACLMGAVLVLAGGGRSLPAPISPATLLKRSRDIDATIARSKRTGAAR